MSKRVELQLADSERWCALHQLSTNFSLTLAERGKPPRCGRGRGAWREVREIPNERSDLGMV